MKKQVVTILLALSMSIFLVACGGSDTTPEPVVEQNNDVQDETTEEIVETETAAVVENVEPAVDEQPTNPEEATYETEQYCSFGFFEEQMLNMEIRDNVPPVVFIKWDCQTKKGQLLELGNEYDIKTGDVIIVLEFHNGDLKVAKDKLPEVTKYMDFQGMYDEEYQFAEQYYTATELPSEPFVFDRKPYDDTDKYDFYVTLNPVQ